MLVRRDLVEDSELTGEIGSLTTITNESSSAPVAKIRVTSKLRIYISIGEIEALCLDEPLYDLTIGDIPGVKSQELIDIDFETCSRIVDADNMAQRKPPEKDPPCVRTEKDPDKSNLVENL